MTEYTTSSEAIREYLTARDRTMNWVSRHFQYGPEDDFMSPSAPPSELDDSDAPSYGPSDSDDESTHSLPPRMILRWNDGRPDLPIAPETRHAQPLPQSRTRSNHSTSREPHPTGPFPPPSHHTVSHHPSATATAAPYQRARWEQTLSYVTVPPQDIQDGGRMTPPRSSPEHIVVLPSPQDETVPQAPITSAPLHSVPPESHLPPNISRTPTQGMYPAEPALPPVSQPAQPYPPQHGPEIVSPSPQRAYNPSNLSRHTTHSPPITQSYSQPLPAQYGGARIYDHQPGSRAPSQLPYAYSPPAIVYAPSSRHGGSHYAPPPIVYSPASHGHGHGHHPSSRGPAPSITYSHSAPLPHGHHQQFSHGTAPQYGSLRGAPSHLSSTAVEEEPERSARSHSRSVSRGHRREGSEAAHPRGRSPAVISVPRSPARALSASPPLDDGGSDTSGSTYYILPTPGQKVQIIQTGAPSLYTATSTTKSGHHSPHSAHSPSSPSGSKKPFFQRIFNIPKLPSSVTSHAHSRGSSGSATRKLHRRPTVAPHAQQQRA